MPDYTDSKYRWYILSLGIATHMFAAAIPFMCMPVLFEEISLDLGLNLVQIGVVWGMIGLPGVFCGFASGMITDKYGAARTLGVACLAAGLIGAARGLSDNFATLTAMMFLFGIFYIPLGSATHKAAGQWFSAKQLGLANGLLAAGMGAGNMIGASISATVLSPLFGGWRNLVFVYGGIALVIGILWLTAKRVPTSEKNLLSPDNIPFRQSLSHVIRLKPVWMLSIFMLCIGGYFAGLTGYIPLYLLSIDWSTTGASMALTLFTGMSILGAVPLTLISDKLGRRKTLLYVAIISVIIALVLLVIFGGSAAWVSMVLAGLVQEAFFALSITVLIETDGVGAAYAGTALGLTGTLAGIGSFIVPPIGNRLALIDPRLTFLLWIVLAVAALLSVYFIKETGWRRNDLKIRKDLSKI